MADPAAAAAAGANATAPNPMMMMPKLTDFMAYDNPVFRNYCFWTAILVIKMLLMSILTIVQRFRTKVCVSLNVCFCFLFLFYTICKLFLFLEILKVQLFEIFLLLCHRGIFLNLKLN